MTRTDWIDVYRESAYSFPCRDGGWHRFTLSEQQGDLPKPFADIIGHRGSLTIITAWNPMSVERSLSANECANAELRKDFEEAGVDFDQAFGSSLPGVSPNWQEDGFVLFGLDQEQAMHWGQHVQQRALVWMDAKQAGLLFCEGNGFVPCGVQEIA
ncbi:MAG: DUF3293 domain-containing protein [Planctomycetota bacterium]|jgi:hypothetical protein|nr:DUF3293 domain-containing protein [Planctomycetota bacterium]